MQHELSNAFAAAEPAADQARRVPHGVGHGRGFPRTVVGDRYAGHRMTVVVEDCDGDAREAGGHFTVFDGVATLAGLREERS